MNRSISTYFIVFLGGLFLSGCQNDSSISSEGTMLTLTAEKTGLDFSNTLRETTELNIIEYLYYYNGGGVAIGDVNNDGLEDIYFTANQGPDKLYFNKGDLTFEDFSQEANIIQNNTWSTGVSMADLNNDGFLDIYVCKVGVGKLSQAHNQVYINQQNGTFREMSAQLGLDFQGFSTQAAFLDYDKDGDLDLYLLNHNIHSIRSYGNTQKRQEQDPYAGDRFFENRMNEKEQRFVDVSKEVGIYTSPLGYGLAITCADLNGDGWTDIYVGNDFHENDYLYFNNGDKTFTEAVADWTDHTTQFSMGVDIADINNDLLPDIFSTDMLPFDEEIYLKSGGEDTDQIKRIKADLGFEEQFARNHLQVNTGMGSFMDIALKTRTFATDWSWAPLIQDFDNNGRKDIFITNGIAKRPNDLDYINYLNSEAISQYQEDDPERTVKLIEKLPSQKLHNILFFQKGDLDFTEIAQSKVGRPSFSNGAAFGDLDQDGYLELVINNIDEPVTILKYNKDLPGGNYLTIALEDPAQKTVHGSKVYAYSGDKKLFQELQPVKGYQSSSSHRLHFGLGENSQVDSLVIVWPDLSKQIITGVGINTQLKITKEDSGQMAALNPIRINNRNFNLFPLPHRENGFNDDEKEKLIPEELSREGPAVLYEDLDADGIKDLLIGGAHGQAPRLLKGKKDGSFDNLQVDDFSRDARYEDVSAATIDFDGDGDKDIYIASGGSIAQELDKVLEDRLYLNNGGMDFRRIPLSLPHTNASVITVADFDEDGYEDLFVGARSMPGSYGFSPYSFVLTNQKGMGIDIAYQHRFGLVTDAQWADFDGDQDLDLLLCGDWMPVTILRNEGDGKLDFLPEEENFPKLSGFWNTLEIADLNQDGQLDILAGNIGANSLLNATSDHPAKLYLGDFDNNGSVDPVIFFYYFNRYVPLGSKNKFLSQLPGLKKDFVSYQDFSKVSSFNELLPEAEDRLVETKEVNELRSMLFLSQQGTYKAIPLPDRLQMVNLQDFLLDAEQGNIYYIGGNKELVAVRGNAMASKAGMLANFDPTTGTFSEDKWLRFPIGVNARTIIPLQNGGSLIVTNNDYPYLVEWPE
jgi:hypothetical protein